MWMWLSGWKRHPAKVLARHGPAGSNPAIHAERGQGAKERLYKWKLDCNPTGKPMYLVGSLPLQRQFHLWCLKAACPSWRREESVRFRLDEQKWVRGDSWPVQPWWRTAGKRSLQILTIAGVWQRNMGCVSETHMCIIHLFLISQMSLYPKGCNFNGMTENYISSGIFFVLCNNSVILWTASEGP